MELKEGMSMRVEEERDKQDGFVNFTKVMKKGVVNCYGFELHCLCYSDVEKMMLFGVIVMNRCGFMVF
jgi:hypothetical protein